MSLIRRPHISPSQMDMYFRCGEQYRRRYIQGEKIPPGIALIKGGAVHKAAETNFQQKIESHEDLPVEQLLGAAEEHLDVTIAKEGLFLSSEEKAVGAQTVIGEAKDRIYAMTRVLHREVAPRIQPALVERFVRIELPHHSHDLLGRLDLATAEDEIIDLKTSSKRKYQDEVDRSDQLTYYHLAYEHETGRPATGVRLEVLVETKVPSVQTMRSVRGDRDRKVFASRISAMLDGVRKGVFLPAAPGSWVCGPKFCGYWSDCPLVNSERKAAAEALNV